MIYAYIASFLLGAALAYYLYQRRQPKAPKYFAACEFWVYIPHENLPPQDDVMTRMVAQNPHGKGAKSPIGPREGILFSDVRLDVSLVRRAKNPHVFRPDLFSQAAEPTEEILNALAKSHALIRIRYISEEPLKDDRHLQFLTHMADATAAVAEATVVYDVVTERLMTPEELYKNLHENGDATDPDFHLRVVWSKDDSSGHAETKGLIKKGLPELVTHDARLDNRLLVSEVLLEAAKKIWKEEAIPEDLTVQAYMDEFRIEMTPQKDGKQLIRILRIVGA